MAKKLSTKNLSLTEIQELLVRKIEEEKKHLPKLLKKRENLQKELDDLNLQIEMLQSGISKASQVAVADKAVSAPRAKRGRRPQQGKKRVPLPQVVAEILKKSKKPMGPTEITTIIRNSNHPSAKTASLRLQVNNILTKRPEFERLGRGKYRLKK